MKVPNGQSLTSGDLKVRVIGELVPIVEVELPQGESVYFEHHTILSKDPAVAITAKALGSGLGRRMIAGLPLIVVEAAGPGMLGLSRDGAGEAIVLELSGHEIDVPEHRFLFATSGVRYGYTRVKGFANIFGSGTGFFMDRFAGSGLLVLHGYGNVVERELASGEAIDLEPSAWLYKDANVGMDTYVTRISTGLLGGVSLWMTRFTGPGRLAYQSLTPVMAAPSQA